MGPRRPAGRAQWPGLLVHVVPPGKKAFPFHRHHVMDELFFIVSGEGEYRFGDTTVNAPAEKEPSFGRAQASGSASGCW